MKKKGFTLIELLAVIVILAVIALIATPAVLNIIEDSKKSAAEASARNIASAAKAYYMQNLMNNISVGGVDLTKNKFTYDGEQATKGYITYGANGAVSGNIYVSGYCIEIQSDGSVTSTKVSESECEITLPAPNIYLNGTIVYFNPVTNMKCSSSEAVIGHGSNNACLKWYTFLDSEEAEKVKLILSNNTSKLIDCNNISTKLQEDISNWNSTVKATARLISAEEIAEITGYSGWTNNGENFSGYYLHNNSSVEYKGETGTNKYAWLFDYTIGCTSYGCNISGGDAYGYWTSTRATLSDAYATNWFVTYTGRISFLPGTSYNDDGIRPVIEVPKKLLK